MKLHLLKLFVGLILTSSMAMAASDMWRNINPGTLRKLMRTNEHRIDKDYDWSKSEHYKMPSFTSEQMDRYGADPDEWRVSNYENLGCNEFKRPKQFKFCHDSSEVNMINAFWLACLAGNQYSSFQNMFNDLTHNLGFNEGEGSDLRKLVESIVVLFKKTKFESPELFKFISKSEDERSKTHITDIPIGYEKFMAQKSFLIDQIVQNSSIKSRSDKRKIDFYSTRHKEGESILGKNEVIDILNANGITILDSLLDTTTEELNKKYDSVKIGGTQVFWAEHSDFVVIGVRGTEPTQYEDVIADLVAFQVMFDIETKTKPHKSYTSFLHTGFNAAFAKVMEEFLTKKLAAHRYQRRKEGKLAKPLYITGHSLGGAVANLIASRVLIDNFKEWVDANHKTIDGKPTMDSYIKRLANSRSFEFMEYEDEHSFCEEFLPTKDVPKDPRELQEYFQAKLDKGERVNYIPIKGVYTFGAPRVGDGTFKKIVECMAKRSGTAIARFRNRNDIVPTVPHFHRFTVLPYEHFGHQIVFDTNESGDQRIAHARIDEQRQLGDMVYPIKPLQEFYHKFASDNFELSDGAVCRPGTKCWAHANLFYYLHHSDDPKDIPVYLDPIKSIYYGFKNRSFIASAGADHSIASLGNVHKSEVTNDYTQVLYAMYPKTDDIKCSDYDLKLSPELVHDVVWSEQTRKEKVSEILDQTNKIIRSEEKKSFNKNYFNLINFRKRLEGILR